MSPSHVMAVGPGMLDASVSRQCVRCPLMDYVPRMHEVDELEERRATSHQQLHSAIAPLGTWRGELAEAEEIKIGVVLVNDDVAVMNSAYTVGRRGVAGNFFVIKACGAAAATGASLEDLVKLGEKVVSVVRTMGVAISGCRPPGKDKPIFELAEGEMEMGVGIHGEKGRRRDKLPNADAVVDELFDATSKDLPFNNGDNVGLMINGLGGTPAE